MSRNFSPNLIIIKILEKINILFFYYIKLLQKVLGVALGISATFRTMQFWCSCAHSARWHVPPAWLIMGLQNLPFCDVQQNISSILGLHVMNNCPVSAGGGWFYMPNYQRFVLIVHLRWMPLVERLDVVSGRDWMQFVETSDASSGWNQKPLLEKRDDVASNRL
jgi:hypothetical protein